tara:strand:+ start:1249 stop:2490 length:1242 start_codon:yes stop_codon:yes gene_type:complete
MASINGLSSISATSIQNSGEFYLGNNLDSGQAGDTIVSNGANQAVSWGTHTGTINALTAGTNISYASGNPTFNGSVADTINATDTDTTYTAGNGVDLTGTTFSTDNDGTTINNTGGSGTQNQVLKVPNTLTINGSAYDGSAAIVLTTPDTTYQGSATINVNPFTTPYTLNCIKVPNTLTINGSAYDGSAAVVLTTPDTTYAGGNNISINTTPNPDEIDLDTSIVDMRGITYESGFFATGLTGNDYPGSLTIARYLDLSSLTNIQALPPDVFDVSGDFRMTINLSNFMSNDDSTFYNIFAEDDGSAKIHGAIKPANAVVEMVGYFIIPSGFTATACRIDITDSGGSGITRDLTFESFTTYGATGFSALGTGPSGSEQSFSSNLVSASDKLLLIRIDTTATTDHVRGGYILLTRT